MTISADRNQDVSFEQYCPKDTIQRLAKLYFDYGYQIETLIGKSAQNYMAEVVKILHKLCDTIKTETKDYKYVKQKKNTYIEYLYPKTGQTKIYIQAVFDDPSKISSRPSICVTINNKVKNKINIIKALENKIRKQNFIEFDSRTLYLVCDVDLKKVPISKVSEVMFEDLKYVINSVNEVRKLLDG
jgi:hypothetical protein